MRHCNKLRCPIHLMAVISIVFLLSACAPGPAPPPSSPQPIKLSGQIVNVKHYLPVRMSPSLKAAEVGRLLPGENVYITQDAGEWCTVESVRLQNGLPVQGWVLHQFVVTLGSAGPAEGPGGPGPGPGGPGPGGPGPGW